MRRIFLLLAIIVGLMLSGIVSACGGFFCQNTPIDQSAERIIFTVNGNGTITAIVGINYVGAAPDFSWVVPVPSPPELDVAETASLDTLQQITDIRFNPPERYCNNLFNFYGRGGGGGGGGLFIEKGNIGPYDYVTIGGQDVDELIQWLRDNDYRIEPEMEPIIAQYVEEGMLFLAMKLSAGQDVSDIQPIQMTYRAEKPMIPIRLTAIAAVDDMPILTWIFADTQYQPENYASVQPDFTDFRGQHEVASLGDLSARFNQGIFEEATGRFISNLELQYIAEQERIQAEYDGLAFITQYAGESNDLLEQVSEDPLLLDLIERFPYVTRLRAQQDADQMTLDPIFAPAPDAPDISNTVNLGEYVDPLHYNGCTSRTALTDAKRDILPDGRTFSTAFNMMVAHPADWRMTELDYEGQTIQVFSPGTVTSSMIDSRLAGQMGSPMLLLVSSSNYDSYETRATMARLLGYPIEKMNYQAINAIQFEMQARPVPFGYEGDSPATFVAILADWQSREEYGAALEAMLTYATSFEHYLHPDLAHTLISNKVAPEMTDIDGPPPGFMIGYPEGWVEYTTDEGQVELSPTAMRDASDDDKVLVRPLLAPPENITWDATADTPPIWLQRLLAQYDLAEDVETTLSESVQVVDTCLTIVPPLRYEQDGRIGYVRPIRGYVIDASAPAALFEDYQEILYRIVSTVPDLNVRCG
ncbi:MAG: DUF2330 domain-containing protein [Aggregatilineales bacterium]